MTSQVVFFGERTRESRGLRFLDHPVYVGLGAGGQNFDNGTVENRPIMVVVGVV